MIDIIGTKEALQSMIDSLHIPKGDKLRMIIEYPKSDVKVKKCQHCVGTGVQQTSLD